MDNNEPKSNNPYSIPLDEPEALVGPNGFNCVLAEWEDRIWSRDGQEAVDRLNKQHDLLVRALDVISKLVKEDKQLDGREVVRVQFEIRRMTTTEAKK